MTKPRSTLVSLSDTPWYHVVNRCVRRAFLCGDDAHTGKNHDHRRDWIVNRVKQLSGVFAIDVAAYAVMSNHYHLVLRVDAERAKGWSNEEVLRRWTQLFDGPLLVQRLLSGQGGERDQATLKAIDYLLSADYNETIKYTRLIPSIPRLMKQFWPSITRLIPAETLARTGLMTV
jgi:hypothetical protein